MIWQFVDSRTVGGIERHVEILTRNLIARGNDARVVLLKGYADQPTLALFENVGLPVQRLDGTLRGLIRASRSWAAAEVRQISVKLRSCRLPR